jgi:hypothetical protein
MSGQWKRPKGEVGPILARFLRAISLLNGGMQLQFCGIRLSFRGNGLQFCRVAWRVDGIGLMFREIPPAFSVLPLAF